MIVNKLEFQIMLDGRTKKEVALACGFANTRLSEYTHGKKEIPVSHLILLADVLKCDPRDLIGETELVDTEMAWG